MSRMSHQHGSLGYQAAGTAAAAAIARAEALGIQIVVAVLDRAGHTLCLMRMNEAFFHSSGLAEDKAYTAVSFGFPTDGWGPVVEGNPALESGLAQRARLVMIGGGLPVRDGDQIIGAIGVSGGSEAQDIECAQAGLAAIE